jgi:hypothetical protein
MAVNGLLQLLVVVGKQSLQQVLMGILIVMNPFIREHRTVVTTVPVVMDIVNTLFLEFLVLCSSHLPVLNAIILDLSF